MNRLLPKVGVIADDLTGGGDVGIQFADRGLDVVLSTDIAGIENSPDNAHVWVINTDSRAIDGKTAASRVKKALDSLKKWGADYFYKKIDSTLRGNIGVELDAALEGSGTETIFLCAAFPEMGRVTKDAVHYVNGIEVSESSYGRDIKMPVSESNIEKLLAGEMREPGKVKVFDAETDSDIENIAERQGTDFYAGAAALAGKLAGCWFKKELLPPFVNNSFGPVLAVTGSLNPVSLEQTAYWKESGYTVLEPGKEEDCDTGQDALITTGSLKNERALERVCRRAAGLWKTKRWKNIILNGGDTADSVMDEAGIKELKVVRSVLPGIAVTENNNRYLVLKPGGYGKKDTLVKLAQVFNGQ
ncbi:MAG: four-carbon acid sugar kinase family protein [Elusimicrobiota bacterium]